jgi:hypothetical protein
MKDLPDVVGSGQPDDDALERDGPERDGPERDGPERDASTTEMCDRTLPVRHAADHSAIRPVHRMHDPEVLEQVLQGLINLQ